MATDVRAAWTGTVPELGATPLRLEAGAFAGKVVFVQTIGPWTQPGRVPPPIEGGVERALDNFKNVLVLFLMVGSALLARRMVLLGRGDWRGATTVAVSLFILSMAQWTVGAHQVPDYGTVQNKFFEACAEQLFRAGIAWLAYLGIEPWIRRHWPTSLISWTRVLAGSWRDPLVGRDVLIGLAFGVAGALYPDLIAIHPPCLRQGRHEPGLHRHLGPDDAALCRRVAAGRGQQRDVQHAAADAALRRLPAPAAAAVAGGVGVDRRADVDHHLRGRLRRRPARLRDDRLDLGAHHRAAATSTACCRSRRRSASARC